VPRLRFVPVSFEGQLERAPAQEPHSALRVADRSTRGQLEQPSARQVREATWPGHRTEVVEAVSDHALGRRRRRQKGRDRRCGMLAVRVDREHGLDVRRQLANRGHARP
jgi:hypothetical protein